MIKTHSYTALHPHCSVFMNKNEQFGAISKFNNLHILPLKPDKLQLQQGFKKLEFNFKLIYQTTIVQYPSFF
jgi:hypothetical protein